MSRAALTHCPDCGTPLTDESWARGMCLSCLARLAVDQPSLHQEILDEQDAETPTIDAGSRQLRPGQVLGNRYQIRSRLGGGGMGEVWRAFDLKLRVDVALKALHPRLLENERALETLRQEVRTAREVISPNVCRVFQLEEIDGAELVSMEYVDGQTLTEVLRGRSPLELDEAREIAAQFLAGLEAMDRYAADDYADGIRVWPSEPGVEEDALSFEEGSIRSIDLLPTAPLGAVPDRLHGTVRTRGGDFTGFVQWNRRKCLGSDELIGETPEGERRLRFDTLRSIARRTDETSVATLLDGSEIELSGTRDAGQGNLGVYVEDRRYGRVLVSWLAFERLDFSPGDAGPGYDDFPPGGPLEGTVTTRTGRRLTGRLVYDLDESETTETLDAPRDGVDYTIPFGLVASIVPGGEGRSEPMARVVLHSGEELELERGGDLREGNAGMLVFGEGESQGEYVRWGDVERVELERPEVTYPPIDR